MKKAIKITQNIKIKNKKYSLDFVESNPIDKIVYVSIPSKFYVTEPCSGRYHDRTDLHDADGWKIPITPNEYDSTVHNLGPLEEVGNDYVFTYTNKSDAEIQNQVLNNIRLEQNELVEQRIRQQLYDDLNNETDVDTLLQNQSIYPIWEAGLDVLTGQKYQHFGDNNEMWLWEVITGHTTQIGWEPKLALSLFKRVAHEDEYLAWEQPEGAHDAYNIDDVVWYPNIGDTLYISTVNGNVWAPGVVQGQWIIFNP